MIRSIAAVATLVLLHAAARADDTKLVAVLPLDVTNAKGLDAASRTTFEEGIRTIAGDALEPLGFTVLTGETTLKVLKDNGVDAARACEALCAMAAAQELKASLFISGSVATTEGEHVAYVRIFESARGKQLGSVQLEGKTVKELRKAFEAKADKLFAKVGGAGLAPGTETAPPLVPLSWQPQAGMLPGPPRARAELQSSPSSTPAISSPIARASPSTGRTISSTERPLRFL